MPIRREVVVGLPAYIVAMSTAFFGDRILHYFVALFLAGLGWNFLYLGSSALVAGVATAKAKCRVQGVADQATTTLVDFASLSGGRSNSHLGWNILILADCVHVVIFTCGLGWLGFHQRAITSRDS